jgi:methyl-accepting chemotaxis protein
MKNIFDRQKIVLKYISYGFFRKPTILEELMIRRKYFINPSVQLKYIVMSVAPALVMSIFCIHFLIDAGQQQLRNHQERISVTFDALQKDSSQLGKAETADQRIEDIQKIIKYLTLIQKDLEARDKEIVSNWKLTQNSIILIILLALFGVGAAALIFSHRIVGPIFRIKRYIDMLADGQDIPVVKIRKNDEFQDVADSLEKLRKRIADTRKKG